MDKVSIIIPIYNASKTIEKTILSIINQTYKELEIICVNDGSTDMTKEILENIANNDSRVIIINQINSGVSTARNVGLSTAKGKFVIFVDADDTIEESYIENLVKLKKENCNYLIRTSYIEGKSHKTLLKDRKVIDFNDIKETMLTTNYFNTVWGQLLDNKVITKNKIRFRKDLTYGEDLLFNIQYMTKVQQILYVDMPRIFIYFR